MIKRKVHAGRISLPEIAIIVEDVDKPKLVPFLDANNYDFSWTLGNPNKSQNDWNTFNNKGYFKADGKDEDYEDDNRLNF